MHCTLWGLCPNHLKNRAMAVVCSSLSWTSQKFQVLLSGPPSALKNPSELQLLVLLLGVGCSNFRGVIFHVCIDFGWGQLSSFFPHKLEIVSMSCLSSEGLFVLWNLVNSTESSLPMDSKIPSAFFSLQLSSHYKDCE